MIKNYGKNLTHSILPENLQVSVSRAYISLAIFCSVLVLTNHYNLSQHRTIQRS